LNFSKVQKKFKHARDFGVTGNPNRENFELFKDKIVDYMRDPLIIIKEYTYKKDIEVMHYFNEDTGLNVMIRPFCVIVNTSYNTIMQK
jgi:hypothetical protein